MKAIVSVIMGSTSDLPVMKKATDFLNEMKVPFEVNALSAHRTPEAVEAFSKGAKERGVKIIIAAAGMAAHLPGVIAASTTLPVIGVPINSTLDGMDALLAIANINFSLAIDCRSADRRLSKLSSEISVTPLMRFAQNSTLCASFSNEVSRR